MSTRKHLLESGTLLFEAKKGALTYPVRIITEGQGSSGYYSRELLEASTEAFQGALSFMNHPANPEAPHLRDVTGIGGRLVGAVEGKEVDGVYGLYSEYKPDPRWRDFIEEYGDAIGLSIFIAGEGRDDENGNYVVESFDGSDPYRSVDIVLAAGRGGRFERAAESLRTIESSTAQAGDNGSASAVADAQNERHHMEELTKLVVALTESVATLTAKVDGIVTLSESATAADAAKVDALEVAEKLTEASLSEKARKRVLESVATGATIADAILEEAARKAEYLAESTVEPDPIVHGRVVEGNITDAASVIPKGW